MARARLRFSANKRKFRVQYIFSSVLSSNIKSERDVFLLTTVRIMIGGTVRSAY